MRLLIHTFILLYIILLLFSTIIPNKNPCIFRNVEPAFRLLTHIRLELLVMIQNILSLISMARQDIRNQWLRFRHDKRILFSKSFLRISSPFSFPKRSYRFFAASTIRSSNFWTSSLTSLI